MADLERELNLRIARLAGYEHAVIRGDSWISPNGGAAWIPWFTRSLDSCYRIIKEKGWDIKVIRIAGDEYEGYVGPDVDAPDMRFAGWGRTGEYACAEALAKALKGEG